MDPSKVAVLESQIENIEKNTRQQITLINSSLKELEQDIEDIKISSNSFEGSLRVIEGSLESIRGIIDTVKEWKTIESVQLNLDRENINQLSRNIDVIMEEINKLKQTGSEVPALTDKIKLIEEKTEALSKDLSPLKTKSKNKEKLFWIWVTAGVTAFFTVLSGLVLLLIQIFSGDNGGD